MKSLARIRTANKTDEEAINEPVSRGEVQESVGDDVQKSVDGGVHKAAKDRFRGEAVTLSQTLVSI